MMHAEGPTVLVQAITAVGAVVSSLLTVYLVHRRIVADRHTKWHRDDEEARIEAVVEKLGIEKARVEKLKKVRR